MRIAQVAPIARPIRREVGSSIEHLVWLLTEELVRRGHEVTLFASGDSETSASLHATYEQSYETDSDLWEEWGFHEVMNAAAAFERARDFDIVHSHSYQHALPFTRLTEVAVLHTYHINPSRGLLRLFRRHPEIRLSAVSRYHRSKFAGIPELPVVYNGIDVQSFSFNHTGGDYLLFLGHLIPRKGAAEAVRAARLSGVPLVLAGKGEGEYFEREIAPYLDGRLIVHVGPVSVEERNRLLEGAGALLFTSGFAEPFGLVLVEAMACGTPVAALRRCAVAEIVRDGLAGCVAEDIEELVECIPRAMSLDRATVRREAERFHYTTMVDGYEDIYRRMLAAGDARRLGTRTYS